MECPSPPINSDWEQQGLSGLAATFGAYTTGSRRNTRGTVAGRRADRGAEFSKRVGFVMDNVESVLNLKNLPVDKCQLVYVEDPIVYPFPNNMKLYKGDTLVIEVRGTLVYSSVLFFMVLS